MLRHRFKVTWFLNTTAVATVPEPSQALCIATCRSGMLRPFPVSAGRVEEWMTEASLRAWWLLVLQDMCAMLPHNLPHHAKFHTLSSKWAFSSTSPPSFLNSQEQSRQLILKCLVVLVQVTLMLCVTMPWWDGSCCNGPPGPAEYQVQVVGISLGYSSFLFNISIVKNRGKSGTSNVTLQVLSSRHRCWGIILRQYYSLITYYSSWTKAAGVLKNT